VFKLYFMVTEPEFVSKIAFRDELGDF